MSPRKVTRTPVAYSPIGLETDSWRTLPNLITALRFLLIIPFTYYAARGRDLRALAVFVIAGLSDTLDGTLARWLNQTSKLGRLVDPVADKVLTGIAYVVLSAFRDSRTAIPIWVMVVVVTRDVLILLGCWIVYRIAHDTGFKPTISGKLNTLIELAVIAGFLAATRFPAITAALPFLYVVMTASIVVSFTGYARQGVRMIRTASSTP
jgi:cardiolipin synthase